MKKDKNEQNYKKEPTTGVGKKPNGKSRIISYYHRPGNATNWISGTSIIGVEKSVTTTISRDNELAQKAKSLEGKRVEYIIGIQDCRDIEDILLHSTLGDNILDDIGKALIPGAGGYDAFESDGFVDSY